MREGPSALARPTFGSAGDGGRPGLWVAVLARQLRSPLLILLAVTAAASFFLGESTGAIIIGVILTVSVGLGFFNEYRAEKAAEALHSQIRHRCLALRDGGPRLVDVVTLVPGDVVTLRLGDIVPADLRLVSSAGLECEESVLTGESMPVAKAVEPVGPDRPLAELASCALMGTVVHAGSGTGVVVATAGRTEFGRIALRLGDRHPDTAFQIGLRRFSMLLVRVAAALTAGIFVVNLVLHRPVLDALLFSLAIAVGISPQLLPAVVSTGLAAGTHRLARQGSRATRRAATPWTSPCGTRPPRSGPGRPAGGWPSCPSTTSAEPPRSWSRTTTAG
ncbi:hypothetical protein [Nonomuraea sp. NPDC001023]|uniref:P-type ATPase n=1 Tax=unclassified Nonomuraea TaxID=2593643 RepID=UPI00333275AE